MEASCCFFMFYHVARQLLLFLEMEISLGNLELEVWLSFESIGELVYVRWLSFSLTFLCEENAHMSGHTVFISSSMIICSLI